MKAKVLKKFRDKHTSKIYEANEIITISKERFDEIQSVDKSLVEAVAEEKKPENVAKKPAKKASKKAE